MGGLGWAVCSYSVCVCVCVCVCLCLCDGIHRIDPWGPLFRVCIVCMIVSRVYLCVLESPRMVLKPEGGHSGLNRYPLPNSRAAWER